MRRWLGGAAVVALLALAGCGGSHPAATHPVATAPPTTTPPGPNLKVQLMNGDLLPGDWFIDQTRKLPTSSCTDRAEGILGQGTTASIEISRSSGSPVLDEEVAYRFHAAAATVASVAGNYATCTTFHSTAQGKTATGPIRPVSLTPVDGRPTRAWQVEIAYTGQHFYEDLLYAQLGPSEVVGMEVLLDDPAIGAGEVYLHDALLSAGPTAPLS